MAASDAPALNTLLHGMEADFKVINGLRKKAAGLAYESIEDRMLLVDYRLMRFWYRVTRPVSQSQARKALGEIADILVHFAAGAGQRAFYTSAA